MRTLPQPENLRRAVRDVIKSNVADGCYPRRFVMATAKGDAPDLLAACEGLIVKEDTLPWLENAVLAFRGLLTLEDLVARYGKDWGFRPETIAVAQARVQRFDKLAGARRYE